MFNRKQKSYSISTHRVYMIGKKNGKKSFFEELWHELRPYTKRAVYRQTGGSLIAI